MTTKRLPDVPAPEKPTSCSNPRCEREAVELTMQVGWVCRACYDAYMLGVRIGEKGASGYLSGSDPAGMRYPYWKEID